MRERIDRTKDMRNISVLVDTREEPVVNSLGCAERKVVTQPSSSFTTSRLKNVTTILNYLYIDIFI